ncbi:hypothetical protein FDECE_10208 [Fusarium decemcellulare]|nr:hypothetical protein FDECE_10208 [Fusarium decemcellulare]
MPRPKPPTAAEKKAAAEEKRKEEARMAKVVLRKTLGTAYVLLPKSLGCSTKIFGSELEEVMKSKKPRKLGMNVKNDKKTPFGIPYVLIFTNTQNWDAMLRYLYGDERGDEDMCNKCTSKTGALKGCVVAPDSKACANCDWNRGDKSPRKRKADDAGDSDASEDDSNISDPFEDLALRTCKVLTRIFQAAMNRKKQKTKT